MIYENWEIFEFVNLWFVINDKFGSFRFVINDKLGLEIENWCKLAYCPEYYIFYAFGFITSYTSKMGGLLVCCHYWKKDLCYVVSFEKFLNSNAGLV